MQLRRYPFWIAAGIAIGMAISPAWAQQVSVDGTLSTSVTSPDGHNFTITDGNHAGGNLFHSFSEFSVPTGGSAFFDNALNVKNIIGRVTGGAVSNIDGLLRANGSANLFLLNPSGILFGPNAQLNIGGSFLASTASSLKFADETQFSATVSSPPLLTMSVPVGLQYGPTAAGINVQQSTLRVEPDQTLALVGGNVTVEGGNLTAPSGRVELGAVAGAGIVELTIAEVPLQLRFPDGIARADVSLTEKAEVNASGSGGGDVQLVGRQIMLSDSRVEATTQGSEPGGNLTVAASESVELIGNDVDGLFDSGLFAETLGTGSAGNLSITTGKLFVQGSARVSATTRGAGQGGNLTVDAADSIELIGIDPPDDETLGTLFTGLLADAESTGAAGNLTIQTRRLIVRDGAQVTAATFGAGDGGNLTVNAVDSVELLGVSPSDLVASGLFNAVNETATGNTGDLTVNTGRLIIRDGAQIFAGTVGEGNGGNLTVNASEFIEATGVSSVILFPSGLIVTTDDFSEGELTTGRAGDLTVNTGRLIVRDGAKVEAASIGKGGGQAGNLTVNAFEFVELSGTGPDNAPGGRTGLLSNTANGSNNSAGNVTVNTGRLIVRDGARVGVNNEGSGSAGNLDVRARSLQLDNKATLSAATASGEGGNINLQIKDSLQMRGNSQISAEAGGTGNGGNIVINTDVVAASEDSDIIANAFEGQGGNIQITTQGLFLSPDSEITASSNFGVDGEVEIQRPEVDPTRGLVILPENVIDVAGLVAQGCSAGENLASSEFIVTGRGGLPPNPVGTISSETVLADLGTAPVQTGRNVSGTASLNRPSSAKIVEAQGWVMNPNGQVVLTASAPKATPHSPWLTVSCDRN